MRSLHLLLLPFLASILAAEEAPEERPHWTLEILDARGVETRFLAARRVSGPDRFVGWRGAAQVEVPWERLQEIAIRPAEDPGSRMQATLTLRSGALMETSFDEREGEVLLTGFAAFGKVRILLRDARRIRFLGRTAPEDLPVYGEPGEGVDALLVDREEVATEVAAFRRAGGDNVFPCLRGATSVEVPLRILKSLEVARGEARLTLLSGQVLSVAVPTPDQLSVYRGEAEFGILSIRLGDIRSLTIHRVTPPVRDVDPLAAAGVEEETPSR